MKKALVFGLALAGVMVVCGMAAADGPWESYGKHMNKYYHHMGEAAEEAAEGDWRDCHKELGKANAHYYAADFNRRIAQPLFVAPYETRTYYYGPVYGPGVTVYRTYTFGW